jgi:uncharacterized membrane protein
MSVDRPASPPLEDGKMSAAAIYVLYLLSLPSIGLLMFLGVILAYMLRGRAADWVRTHYDHQIKVFWTTLWWTIGFGVLWVIGLVLSLVLIGLAVLWAIGIAAVILAIWFHLVSALGLLRLLQDKPY